MIATAFEDLFRQLVATLAIILLVGRLAAWVCRRIGVPVVIGELLVGVALGPSIFGAVAPDLRADVFPPEMQPFLRVLSSMGTVLFMFLVGLELDMRTVRASGRRAVTISLSSIALPFILGAVVLGPWLHDKHDCVWDSTVPAVAEGAAPACVPEGGESADDRVATADDGTRTGAYQQLDTLPFSLFVGVTICGTAFAILARILADRGMFKIPLGRTLVASAAVDDVTNFVMLSVVLAVVKGGSMLSVLGTVAMLIAFGVVLAVLVRPVLKRLVTEPYERAGRLQPEHLAIVFIGIFVASWFTDRLGVSPILGAFLFGATIPRPAKSSVLDNIAERIDGVAVTLLLPVFFVVTGNKVDITQLDGGDILPMVAILAVASIGKFVGGAAGARATGVPKRQSLAVGTLMNTRGLAELVILDRGRELGVLDGRIFTMLVIACVSTTLLAAPLLKLVYSDRWLQRDIAEAERRERSSTTERMVVVVPPGGLVSGAGDADDDAALPPAVANQLAVAVGYGGGKPSSQVTLLHLFTGGGIGAITGAMDGLRALQKRVTAEGPSCQVISRASSDIDGDLVAEIARLAPDVAVVVDDHLVRQLTATGTDTMVVSARPLTGVEAVAVAAAGGDNESAAVEVAARLAVHRGLAVRAGRAISGRTARDVGRFGARVTSDHVTSGQGTSDHVTSGQGTSGQGTSGQGTSDQGASESTAVASIVSGDVTADQLAAAFAVVHAGHRDRLPLRERLRAADVGDPITPLTSL